MRSEILQNVDANTEAVVQVAMEVSIKSPVDYVAAVESLKILIELHSKIDSVFDPIIKRAHEAHKEAITQKKGVLGKLEPAEEHLRREIGRYQAEERKKFVADSGDAAGNSGDSGLSMPVTQPVPVVAGVSTRRNWKFRIMDESKIPREYLKVDEARIGSVVRAMRDMTKIPGIEAYSEDTVAVRRDK